MTFAKGKLFLQSTFVPRHILSNLEYQQQDNLQTTALLRYYDQKCQDILYELSVMHCCRDEIVSSNWMLTCYSLNAAISFLRRPAGRSVITQWKRFHCF